MRMVVDANVIVSAILGRSDPLADARRRSIVLMVPEPQVIKAARVVEKVTGTSRVQAQTIVGALIGDMVVVDTSDLIGLEERASERLDARGKPDWPVLAAALLLDADVWSRDRDFFGVGVPVWSTRNIRYASS